MSYRPRRGALDVLPRLPLDVIGEILCFLHLTDLLVLARTSKNFRHFLLARSAVYIWRSARKNVVGLPEPPPDMNELQYASLVFGYGCHYEGCDRKARDTVWHLRIRSCVQCRSRHEPIKTERNLEYRAFYATFNLDPQEYIPCGPFLNSRGKPTSGFQKSHIDAFKNELTTVPLSERQAYLDRRRQTTEILSRFASEGVQWQLDIRSLRITEMRNKRAARVETIREYLETTTFREEIDYFGWDRIRKHPFITSAQDMTDKVRTSIMDELEDYMLGWRELRMEEQVYSLRRQLFVDAWVRYTTDAFNTAPRNSPLFPLPPSATIGFSESINSIIRQPTQPSQDMLLRQQLWSAFPSACVYIIEWHRTVRRELASLLPDYKAEDDDETVHARLKLSTSVFQCTVGRRCRGDGLTLTYPEILSHRCFTLVTPENGPSKDPWTMAKQKAGLAMGGSPWSCRGRVRVHPRQYVVNTVLQCCGKDPGSTTATEMDMQGPVLVCLMCGTREGAVRPLNWRYAVQHHLISHSDSNLEHPWFVAKHSTCTRVFNMLHPLDLRSSSVSIGGLRDYSICLRCPPRIPSWSTHFGFGDLIDHIKKKHDIASPELGKDYMYDMNITPLFLVPLPAVRVT